MDDAKITRVRHDAAASRRLLHKFVFDGQYAGPFVPRGIDPAVVTLFVTTDVGPTTGPTAMRQVLEVMRFYERADAVGTLIDRFLSLPPADQAALRRDLLVCQIVGENGTPEQAATAQAFVDRQAAVADTLAAEFPLLFETTVALAPAAGDASKVEARLARDLAAAAPGRDASDEGLRTYTVLRSATDNDQPRAAKFRAAKVRLSAQPPPQRRAELLAIYLDQSPLSTPVMEVWSARMLRREAFESDPAPVVADLLTYAERWAPAGAVAPSDPFHFVRAVQAITYLNGPPPPPVPPSPPPASPVPPRVAKLYDGVKEKAGNFLWDDPPIVPAKPAARRSP